MPDLWSADPSTGPHSAEALTPCEQRVVALVAEGLTNKAVARALGKSPETVKTQLRSALTKLRMRNRTQLAMWVHVRQRDSRQADRRPSAPELSAPEPSRFAA